MQSGQRGYDIVSGNLNDSFANGKRILITGGSGFIGTNAVEYFAGLGYNVLSIDIKPPQKASHLPLWLHVDILELERLREIFSKFQPHYLLHLAARTDLNEKMSLDGYAANINGIRNVIEVSNECVSLKRIVFASSRMVCRIGYQPQNAEDYCPPNLYGESKVISEQLIKAAEIRSEWIIVRPTSIWGPWFDVPYKIYFETIAKRIYFNISGFNPLKSFGFVSNTVYQLNCLFDASAESINRKTMYLCDYPPLDVNTWSDLIRIRMALSPIPTAPYLIAKLGAVCGDLFSLLYDRFPLTSFRLDNLITDMVYDTSELESICGPLPFNLEEGVRLTVKWMHESDI